MSHQYLLCCHQYSPVVFVLEESMGEYDLDSLFKSLMLMLLPFIVRLYELKDHQYVNHSVACLLSCVQH